MRVFVTGGSGFVGTAVIDELLSRGHTVNALSNRADLDSRNGRVTVIPGGLFDAAALDRGMKQCDAVIHLVGIIMEKPTKGITFERIHVEGTRAITEAAKSAGIRRYIHMSALGTRENAVSIYHRTKYAAEQIVKSSALDWTILRPSMIHGPRGEFMRMQAKWARKQSPPFLFMPYFGRGVFGLGGAGLLQPIYVNDVARAFVDALENTKTIGQTYCLAGPTPISWPAMHQAVAQAVTGHRRWTMPIPAWYAKLLTHVVPSTLLPFNRDQVLMSQEDNTCDISLIVNDFGWRPQEFVTTLTAYAREL